MLNNTKKEEKQEFSKNKEKNYILKTKNNQEFEKTKAIIKECLPKIIIAIVIIIGIFVKTYKIDKYPNALNVDEILEREFENIDHPNYEKIFKVLNDIMKMWAISHSQNRAYIDFNLKNLIYYEHDKIVFVDLFPPILNNINQTNSYKIKNQIDLWTDKYINLGSMLAYFVQPLVIKHKTSKNLYKILKYIFDNAFNIIENQTHLSKDDILLRLNKSSHVFAKRFVDIYKFATQSTDNQQFLDTYLNAKLF